MVGILLVFRYLSTLADCDRSSDAWRTLAWWATWLHPAGYQSVMLAF
jgi:hypothetical protein